MPALQLKVESGILQRLTARVLARTDLTDLTDTSTVKRVLAAVAREIAEVYYQFVLLRNIFDLRRAGGDDLDARAKEIVPGLLRRYGPRRATGRVVFSRASNTGTTVGIPVGTLVKNTETGQTYRTTQYGYIDNLSVEQITGHGVGRDSGEVAVVAVTAGDAANCAAGAIDAFNTTPIGIAQVTGTTACRGGRDKESDDEFRARIIAYVISLVRCTPQALEAIALGVEDATSGKIVQFTSIYEDLEDRGLSILYIDDGAGTAEETATPVSEIIIAAAEDGQQKGRVTTYPFVQNSETLTSDLRGALVRGTDYFINPASGRIHFEPALQAAEEITADYTPYTGLVPAVQRVIDGDPTNRVDYPGARAAGTTVLVQSPTILNIAVDCTIALTSSSVDAVAVQLEVAQAIERYINLLSIGQNVILNELVDAAMTVEGVYDVAFTLPLGNTVIGDGELARTSLAFIDVAVQA